MPAFQLFNDLCWNSLGDFAVLGRPMPFNFSLIYRYAAFRTSQLSFIFQRVPIQNSGFVLSRGTHFIRLEAELSRIQVTQFAF